MDIGPIRLMKALEDYNELIKRSGQGKAHQKMCAMGLLTEINKKPRIKYKLKETAILEQL